MPLPSSRALGVANGTGPSCAATAALVGLGPRPLASKARTTKLEALPGREAASVSAQRHVVQKASKPCFDFDHAQLDRSSSKPTPHRLSSFDHGPLERATSRPTTQRQSALDAAVFDRHTTAAKGPIVKGCVTPRLTKLPDIPPICLPQKDDTPSRPGSAAAAEAEEVSVLSPFGGRAFDRKTSGESGRSSYARQLTSESASYGFARQLTGDSYSSPAGTEQKCAPWQRSGGALERPRPQALQWRADPLSSLGFEVSRPSSKTSAHPPSRRADAVFAKLAGVSPITSSGSKVTTPTALPAPPLSSRSTSKTAPRRVVPSWRRASTTTWGAAGDPALISSPAARSSLDLCGDLDGRVMLFEPVPPAERARPVQESPAQEVEEVHEQPPETCASGELVRTGLIHSDAKFVHDGERHMMSNLAPSTTQADVAIVEEISDDDQAEPAAVPPASASVPDTTLPCIGMDSGTSAKLSEQVVEAEDAAALDVQDTQQDDDAWEAPTERDVWVAALCLCPCDIADVPQAYLSDRNVAFAALARNGEGLMYVAQSLRKDREVVQAAVNQSGKCLRLANPEFQSDKEIVLAAVRHNGEALDCAARELRHDREVAFAAVGQNWRALSHVGKELRQDHELVRLACAQNGEALCYAAEELRADAELVRTAVGTNGRILRFVADALKGDRHVVLRAVGQDGMALQFAIEDLRGDREVVFEAVAQTGLAVSYVSEALRGDKALALVAVRQNGLALARLAKELQTDRDVVLAAVAQNGDALGSASEGLRRDREVVLDAVSQCGTSLRFAAKELQGDAKIVVAAATQNPGAMEYAAKDLFSNRQVMLAAVQKDWRYLQRATLEIKHDREVVRAAIRQNVLAFWAAPRELQADWDMVCAAFGEDGADVWFATGQILGEREAVLTAAGAKGREFRGAGGGLPGEWRKVLTTLGENWQAVESALDARPSSFLGA